MADRDVEKSGASGRRPRQGGRSARVVAAVHAATLALIEERGYDGVEIPEIARRARVNKTSIYRRWPSKTELVLEVALERIDDAIPIPDTGGLDSDLTRLLVSIRAILAEPFVQALLRVMVAHDRRDKASEQARDIFWRARFAAGGAIVKAAVARGELPEGTSASDFLECAVAPLFYRSLITGMGVTDEDIRRFARQACLAFAAS